MRVPQEVLVNFNRGVLPLKMEGKIVYTHNSNLVADLLVCEGTSMVLNVELFCSM